MGLLSDYFWSVIALPSKTFRTTFPLLSDCFRTAGITFVLLSDYFCNSFALHSDNCGITFRILGTGFLFLFGFGFGLGIRFKLGFLRRISVLLSFMLTRMLTRNLAMLFPVWHGSRWTIGQSTWIYSVLFRHWFPGYILCMVNPPFYCIFRYWHSRLCVNDKKRGDAVSCMAPLMMSDSLEDVKPQATGSWFHSRMDFMDG